MPDMRRRRRRVTSSERRGISRTTSPSSQVVSLSERDLHHRESESKSSFRPLSFRNNSSTRAARGGVAKSKSGARTALADADTTIRGSIARFSRSANARESIKKKKLRNFVFALPESDSRPHSVRCIIINAIDKKFSVCGAFPPALLFAANVVKSDPGI